MYKELIFMELSYINIFQMKKLIVYFIKSKLYIHNKNKKTDYS